MSSSSTRLGFTGDVMLSRLVDRRQRGTKRFGEPRSVDAVWGDLLDRLQSLDGLFCNLECCLSTRGRPWRRTYRPFHFRADPDWAVPALSRAGVDWVSLANNHLLDFEEPALRETLSVLDGAGIAHAGAGRMVEEAREPSLVTIGDEDLAVALVSFTDNTPEYAADDDPGVAHVSFEPDDRESRTILEETLSIAHSVNSDLLVASLHWGPNMVIEPPESFRTTGRWLIDQGVDIVHGHSAHVFQGIEIYDGRSILYDTGDFVDDYRVDEELHNDRGFLFEFQVAGEGDLEVLRLHPIEIHNCAVHSASSNAAEWCRNRMRELSDPFSTEFEQHGEELVVSLG